MELKKSSDPTYFMYKLIAITTLSGLLFGFDTGIISGAIIFIQKTFSLDTFMTELVVGSVLLGAFLGAISSGNIANRYGRKQTIKLDAILFIIGSVCSSIAPNLIYLLLGRLVVGFAIGIASYIAPLYIAELSPMKYRGGLVALNTVAVTSGIVASYCIGYMLASTESWRWMLGIGVFPAIALLIGVEFLPESTRWLVKEGKLASAKKLLDAIRESPDSAQSELDAIRCTIKDESPSWRLLLQPNIRGVLLIGMILACIQQLTGINTILYYTPLLFQQMGFQSTSVLMLLTVGVGMINLLMTLYAIAVVDSLGRRTLLLRGLALMTMSLFILSYVLQYDLTYQWVKWMSISSLFVFVAAYASSIGCIFWIVIAEIYPLHIRSVAMSVASSVNWAANLFMALTFLTLIDVIGISSTFLCYSLISFLSWLFCYKILPETARYSLEEIEEHIVMQKVINS